MSSRAPSAGDVDRIDSLEQRISTLESSVHDDIGRLHEKSDRLREDMGIKLEPILARQHQLVGVSSLIGLAVGGLMTKLVEVIWALFPPPHH